MHNLDNAILGRDENSAIQDTACFRDSLAQHSVTQHSPPLPGLHGLPLSLMPCPPWPVPGHAAHARTGPPAWYMGAWAHGCMDVCRALSSLGKLAVTGSRDWQQRHMTELFGTYDVTHVLMG